MFVRFSEFSELVEFKLFELFYENFTIISNLTQEFLGFRGIFLIIGLQIK